MRRWMGTAMVATCVTLSMAVNAQAPMKQAGGEPMAHWDVPLNRLDLDTRKPARATPQLRVECDDTRTRNQNEEPEPGNWNP